jgi:hypothetical protein
MCTCTSRRTGRGHLSLDDELIAASARYFKTGENSRSPTVEQIADYYRQRRLAA